MLAVIDLAATLNGSFPGDAAIYDRTDLGASGSGNIDSFVRVGATGVEEGFNSSFRPTQMNEDSTLTFNHDLQLAAVPIVVINGVSYREFLLDTNEPGGTDRFISLNKLEIYLSSAGSITAYPFNDATGPTATKIYDMDAGTTGTDTASPSPNGNWVLIDNNLGPGSGAANIFVYIPNSLFDANLGTFVTLYSQFGVTVPASSGSEEWAVREATALFSISGRKFNDLDADHTDDGGTDPGLQGWTIYIDSNNNSQLDVGEPSTVTAADGTYTLGSLIAGTYEVCEVQQAGWTQTFPQTLDGCHTVTVGPNATNINFGNNSTVATTGAKFNDLDGDGTRDAGEPGLLNWEIRAYADANGNSLLDQGEFDGGAAATALTNASGDYQLLLNPGAYVLVEVQQTGWTQTFPAGASVLAVGLNTGAISLGSRGYALTLATGQNVAGLDFGNFDNVDLSGQKFHDLDGDGIQDAGESGLAGWTIQLDLGANGTVDATAVTDASGNYSFTNLGPATYRLREVQQAGWTQTTANPADVTLVSGQNVAGINFGNFQNIAVSGQKFNDLDGDGIKDAGESGLINWTIQLDVGANGTVDATTMTDASGNYSFTNLGPGTYRIREVQQAGWIQTTANPADVVAVGGTSIGGVDFGNFQLITISGQKFHDLDGDGVQDAGESGLINWTIQLDVGANGTVDATTTTDASGNYTFAGLGPGVYRIREVQQALWTQTTANPADITATSGQIVSGINFGNFQNIAISGQKFNDMDGDGIKDAGEPGLIGWTIQLDLGANGTVDATAITDASGNYSFANLGPGTYRIREVQQATWTQTTANPADIAAVGGTNVSGVDFGNTQALSISGQKFNDLDGDGIKDLGEMGLLGWTIQLDAGADGSVDATTTTDAAGNYTFTNIAPGLYRIREVQQALWTQTTANPADVLAVSGQNITGVDFGNFQLISISGQKFNDLDGDGIQDAGEPGLGNWTIQLDLGANGTVDATTTTDASGNYSFTNLGPGVYRVREVQQAGWVQTTANPADVTAVSGQLVVGLNFGNFQLIDITGQKFNDLDGDGIQDAGEPGLAGVTITLDIGADGTIDATTVTGAGGSYSFTNLPPGVYRIREVVPAGAIQTTPNPADIVATSGSGVSGVDFGNFTLITLSGQKFHDLDGDGVKEAGESGLPGWTIQLDIAANGTVDATAVTDALGNYSFANLGPGAYRIREVQQSGWTQTTANPADIVAVSGTNVSGIDFGNDQIDEGGGGGIIVIGPDKSPQTNAQVKVVDVATGQILASFLAYEPGFLGGTRVATGDLTGDGIDEIITAPGRGRAPQVRVFTQDGVELTQFRTMAYASSFLGGIHVAVGDVNGDSRNDIITVPGSGKAIVKVFLGQANADPIANTPFKTFYAFAKTFVGGATVRAADMGQRLGSGTFVNSLDGKAEIIVGSGPGAKATVKVFQVQGTPSLVRSFNPFSTATSVYKNGVNLEVERLDADAVPDIIVGSENGGNSRIETWIWNTGNATLFRSGWFESYYDSASKIAPSRVAALDTTGDGIAETLATVQGPGGTTAQIRTFDVSSAVPLGVAHATSLNGFAGPYFIAAIDDPSGPIGEPAAEAEADEPMELALTTTAPSAPTFDPSGDGALTAMDALLVINALNQQSAGTAPTDAELASLDVNGDGRLTAVDALLVLNELNQAAAAAVAALAPATTSIKEDDYAANVDALFAELA